MDRGFRSAEHTSELRKTKISVKHDGVSVKIVIISIEQVRAIKEVESRTGEQRR